VEEVGSEVEEGEREENKRKKRMKEEGRSSDERE
jgi:hypothetical protein